MMKQDLKSIMKQITIDMLESVESEIENDEDLDLIRYKIRTAVDKSPDSVTLEAAMEQVENSSIQRKNGIVSISTGQVQPPTAKYMMTELETSVLGVA